MKTVQYDPVQGRALGAAVHIHTTNPQQVDIMKYSSVLDKQERARSRAFAFKKDRDLFKAAHIFLRKILSLYARINPDDWMFVDNQYGKPAISNEGYGYLCFNLSHTRDLIACAVCCDREIGVDVEYVREMADLPGLASCVLTGSEQTDLFRATGKNEQKQAFFTYWTLKEAYIKARGKGLSIPLKEIEFMQSKPGLWACVAEPEAVVSGEMWMLKHRLQSKHVLALSVQKTSGEVSPDVYLTHWGISPRTEALAFNIAPG